MKRFPLLIAALNLGILTSVCLAQNKAPIGRRIPPNTRQPLRVRPNPIMAPPARIPDAPRGPKPPGPSGTIKIGPPIVVNTAAAVSMCSADPYGTAVDVGTAFVGALQVTSFPTGGTNTTLWVDLQTTYDDGKTWSDAAQFNIQSTGTWYFPFSTLSYGSVAWETDGSQWSVGGQGTLYQSVVGRRVRIKYGTQLGSPAGSGTYSFQVTLQPTSDLFGHGLQTPVELCPLVSTSKGVTPVAPLPLGKKIHVNKGLVGYVQLVSVPSGGSGQTLDIYLQHSCDDGQTWSDLAHTQPSGSGPSPSILLLPISALSPGPTTISAIADGTLAAGTSLQGPIGDRLRIKYAANMGTGNTGSWSFYALVFPD